MMARETTSSLASQREQALLKGDLVILSQPWTLWSKKSRTYLSDLMIEALLMVRTEAGMNIHQTVFIHHHQAILITTSTTTIFFPTTTPTSTSMSTISTTKMSSMTTPYKDLTDDEELINTFYFEDDFEDEGYDGRTVYE